MAAGPKQRPEAHQQERELQRLRNEQLTEGEEDIGFEEDDIDFEHQDGDEEEDIDVILEEDNELTDSGVIEQEPGRMISPSDADDTDDEADDYGKSD